MPYQKPYKKDWLIIAHGEPVEKKQLLTLAENKSIMVLDGAFTSALLEDIQPDIVLGDFDSIHAKTDSILFIHTPNPDATDLEKGLHHLMQYEVDSISITNATGWRLDHTLYNLRLLKRFHTAFKSMVLWTLLEKIFYIENQTLTLHAEKPEPFALLSFPEAVVSSTGLQHNMKDLTLKMGQQESVSNTIVSETAQIEVKGGALLLLSHQTYLAI